MQLNTRKKLMKLNTALNIVNLKKRGVPEMNSNSYSLLDMGGYTSVISSKESYSKRESSQESS